MKYFEFILTMLLAILLACVSTAAKESGELLTAWFTIILSFLAVLYAGLILCELFF